MGDTEMDTLGTPENTRTHGSQKGGLTPWDGALMMLRVKLGTKCPKPGAAALQSWTDVRYFWNHLLLNVAPFQLCREEAISCPEG